MMFNNYLATLTETEKNYTKIAMRYFCDFRKITVEQFNEQAEQEKDFIVDFIESSYKNLKKSTLEVKAHYIRKYLQFSDVEINTYEHLRDKLNDYMKDEKLNDFLLFVGTNDKTKKRVGFMIKRYCEFRNKSATALVKEAKKLSKNELEILVMKFYNQLMKEKLKTAWSTVRNVKRFYKRMNNIEIDIQRKDTKKRKLMSNNGKTLIDKKTIYNLLHVAPDFRDSAVILCLWESGVNPVDLVSLNYSTVKDFLNLENPEAIKEAEVFVYERSKNEVEFVFCLGINTLKHLSKMIKVKIENGEVDPNEDFALFTGKSTPHKRISPENVYNIVRRIGKKAGYTVAPNDFRNSFNTLTKTMLKHFDKEIFMGHVGGIERNYDISELPYWKNEYQKVWEILFDLTFDNIKMKETENYFEAKVKQLQQELKQRDDNFIQMKMELEEMKEDYIIFLSNNIVSK